MYFTVYNTTIIRLLLIVCIVTEVLYQKKSINAHPTLNCNLRFNSQICFSSSIMKTFYLFFVTRSQDMCCQPNTME